MPLINTFIKSSRDATTYACVNELIGMLKTILLNDPNVTIISDNNPSDSMTMRVMDYKVGSNAHYYRLYGYRGYTYDYYYSYLYLSVRNISNSADLYSSQLMSPSGGVWVRLLYGSNIHVLYYNSYSTFCTCAINTGDPIGWYAGAYASSYNANLNIFADNDGAKTFYLPTYSALLGGTPLLMPAKFAQGGTITDYQTNLVFGISGVTTGIYKDANGLYYIVYGSFLFKEG